jgi:hypothetical protein
MVVDRVGRGIRRFAFAAWAAGLGVAQADGLECHRSVGGTFGLLPTGNSWELIGDGPVTPVGSPAVSLGCQLLGPRGPYAGVLSAPLERHWYRNGGAAGLFAVPYLGLGFGNEKLRFGVHAIAMTRLLGAGLRLEVRWSGDPANRWTHTAGGVPRGLDVRLQYLDGDVPHFQLAALLLLGVDRPGTRAPSEP